MTEQLAAATAAQARGWYPFPVDHPGAPNCMGTACQRAIREEREQAEKDGRRADYVHNVVCQPGRHDKRGKHPVGRWSTMAVADKPVDPKMLTLWFGQPARPTNVGIACKPSRLVVLDEDKLAALQLLAAELGQEIPQTYRVRTARGWHYYFAAPTHVQLGNRSGRLKAHGIDVRGGRGDGGYVLGHGSVHASGVVYTAEDLDAQPAQLPQWLIDEIQDHGGPASNGAAPLPAGHDAGGSGAAGPIGRATTPHPGAAGQPSGGVWGYQGRLRPGDEGWGGWDNEPRFGTAEQLRGQYDRRRDEVLTLRGRVPNAGFRSTFFCAARDGWRLRELGLLSPADFNRDMLELIAVVWGTEPDRDDKDSVKQAREGRDGALASPWRLIEDPAPAEDQDSRNLGAERENRAPGPVTQSGVWGGEDQQEALSETPAGPSAETLNAVMSDDYAERIAGEARRRVEENKAAEYEADVASRVRWLDVSDEATKRRRARDRGDKPSIRSKLINVRELHAVKPPTLLVGQLVQEKGVGFLAGKYGSYKTFVAISLACSIASGRPWMDDPQFAISERKRVLYVAAEGAAGVAERIQAWERRYTEIGQEWLDVYPEPIKLADPEEVAELAELVREGEYGFVVIDTFHRSAAGVQENSNSEIGVIFAAMAGIRDECGTTVLFVDHTGHGQAGQAPRIRDASSKGDDSDFVLIVDMPGEDRSPANQRTLSVQKLKDWPTGVRWPLRLAPEPGVGTWSDRRPMLLEIGEIDHAQAFSFEATWFDGEALEVPEALSSLSGKGANAARDIFRILRHIDSVTGVSEDALRSMLGEARQYHRTTVHAALSLLRKKNVVQVGDTATKVRLADRFEAVQALHLVPNEDQNGE